MATFKADNIETDDESDDELDDTKEIQIEEALKVYQTAVKLQSQGKAFLKETSDAYKTLFESDVFSYPESWSEYRRVETYGENLYDPIPWQDDQAPKAINSAAGVENAPSTLPQVLHLSYKNRAQHYLDLVRASLESNPAAPDVRAQISKALNDFTEALDKDEDDVDLWRRAAKISQILKSSRISRYCLETVIEGDEQGTDETLGDPGMEIKLAEHDLEEITQKLEDDVWKNKTPSADVGLPALWRKQLSLYSNLNYNPEPTKSRDTEAINVHVERSWRAVGEQVHQRLVEEQQNPTNLNPEGSWRISVPAEKPVSEATPLEPPNTEVEVSVTKNEDEVGEVTSPEAISAGNDAQTAVEVPRETFEVEHVEPKQSPTTTVELPTRKRSVDAAELPEEPEGGRVRSKRLRARESIVGDAQQNESGPGNTSSGFDEKIQASIEADEWLSDVMEAILEKIGVGSVAFAKPYRDLIAPSIPAAAVQDASPLPLGTAVNDFYNAMQNWSGAKTKKLLQPARSQDTSAEARGSGLSVYLEHSSPNRQKPVAEDFDIGLDVFLDSVNGAERCTAEVAFEWICSLLSSLPGSPLGASSYVLHPWPASLKEIFVNLVIYMDEMLFTRFRTLFDTTNDASSSTNGQNKPRNFGWEQVVLLDVSQSLFEAHLDIYVSNTTPDGKSDEIETLKQRVRLNKWGALARDVINLNLDAQLWDPGTVDELRLQRLQFRHLWASVHQLKVLEDVEREHLLLCIEDLKKGISDSPNLVIELPNNSVMPELSVAAADAEISKLETMDFFIGIFEKEGKAPVDLIESLEPLLEQTLNPAGHDKDDNHESLSHSANEVLENGTSTSAKEFSEPKDRSRSTFEILATFLNRASIPLRLSLWHRLLESYEAIEYPPKLLSIRLRCIQVLVQELISPEYAQKPQEEREEIVLDSIRDLRELLKATLDLTSDGSVAFECLDIDHLRVSIKAVTDLWTLLYAVALFDDYSQAGGKGGSSVNPFRNYPLGSFHAASVKLHDMQIQTSMLLYKLIREAMTQMPEEFANADEVKLDYLRHAHYQFGVRRICKAYDSSFLRFMQDELMSLPSLGQQSSTDLAQVLYDLYDLHCFPTTSYRQDHGCDADYLDRKTAMQLIDFVMDKAKHVSIKDLLKSDLGKSMEKLHSTLGIVKSNSAALRNRNFYTAYLKSPIQPLQLFRSLGGVADISVVPVSPEEGVIASKGWYLLKGQISLAKYRAQRAKNTAGSEDDLNDALAFFMKDLEFDSERWETWYRMAQARDGLLEESILWSADKINNKQTELAELQRETIHTYVMATAVANRNAEPSKETALKLAEMYLDFAVCIYSATRQPFGMRAFSLEDFPPRHFSNAAIVGGEYTEKPFAALTRRSAWKFAISLLKRAARYGPNKWVVHYMLGKCLWKLHTRSDRPEDSRIAVQKAFTRAIETLPERKDTNRHEPILEPIYKLVAISHKLVECRELDPYQGSSIIEETLLKQKQIDVSKRPSFAESRSWIAYVIDILKMLRSADKSRWHHRLVVRAALLISQQGEENGGGAQAAKDYLVEQHIYSTKTYALTVWKPEHERPGRHWVYTQQYAQFLTRLLGDTNDVEGIQLLAKRVRKKTNEFYEHATLWEYVCEKHVAVHRRYGNVRFDFADSVFKHLDQEEFAKRAELIDQWISSPQNTERLYEVLRETSELKKLNAALVKPTAIDELIVDTYAEIWVNFASVLEPAAPEPAAPEPAKPVSDPAPPSVPAEPPVSPPRDERRNIMSLTNLMNVDGATESRTSQAATPTPSLPDQTTTRSKPRLISMREIIKRANDAIVISKPAPKPSTPPPKTAAEPSDTSNIKVIIPQRETQEGGEGDEESARGSVHDEADDESELSEMSEVIALEADVEDDIDGGGPNEDEDDDDEEETSPVVVKPMFPNLHRRSPGSSLSPEAEDSVTYANQENAKGSEMDVDGSS